MRHHAHNEPAAWAAAALAGALVACGSVPTEAPQIAPPVILEPVDPPPTPAEPQGSNDAPDDPPADDPTTAPSEDGRTAELDELLEGHLRAAPDGTFEIDETVLLALLENHAKIMGEARLTPQNGDKLVLNLAEGDSLLRRLGFEDGDELHRVNGFSVGTPDAALEAYASLRAAETIQVDLVRAGKPTQLVFRRVD